jgi:hypothetical protein
MIVLVPNKAQRPINISNKNIISIYLYTPTLVL